MAIDTPARHIYSGDGSTRVFPIPTYIQGDDYIRIEINGVHQVDRSKWDIVNNSIIFVTAPITTSTIDVQVATSVEALAELGSVTNVDIVAANITGINGIASNLDEILLADDNAIIATTKASEASASALVATTKASEALTSATSASASAALATTKTNEASTSASTATTKASEALASATTANTKASEALASATTASTKASEVATSVTSASSSAATATTKAGEASTSASTASTKASEAVASATSANSSATTATTKASEALASATSASSSATTSSSGATVATTKASEAATSATSASSSATTASSGATTATTKASEASTSAINALANENKAKKWADESEDVPVESGLYSAKHWAAKAADIVGAGLIDDVSPSTSTVFSSTRSNNTYEPKNSNIQGHISNNTTNPHNVTKNQVGLSNVDNTSDANKPISAATATALATKLDKSGGTMTGAITAIRETKVAMAANNIDSATGNLFTKTISTATTFTVSNMAPTGQTNSFILELTDAGSQVITWWSGMKWAGGTAPVLTTSGVDILGFYSHDGGTTWRGVLMSKDSK